MYTVPNFTAPRSPYEAAAAPAVVFAISIVPESPDPSTTGFTQFETVLPVSHNSAYVSVIPYSVATPVN